MNSKDLYDVCGRDFIVERTAHINLNLLLAQIMSSFTASLGVSETLKVVVMEFQNLVLYLRIHFMLRSCAPIMCLWPKSQ